MIFTLISNNFHIFNIYIISLTIYKLHNLTIQIIILKNNCAKLQTLGSIFITSFIRNANDFETFFFFFDERLWDILTMIRLYITWKLIHTYVIFFVFFWAENPYMCDVSYTIQKNEILVNPTNLGGWKLGIECKPKIHPLSWWMWERQFGQITTLALLHDARCAPHDTSMKPRNFTTVNQWKSLKFPIIPFRK